MGRASNRKLAQRLTRMAENIEHMSPHSESTPSFWGGIGMQVIGVGLGAWLGPDAGLLIAFLGLFFFIPLLKELIERDGWFMFRHWRTFIPILVVIGFGIIAYHYFLNGDISVDMRSKTRDQPPLISISPSSIPLSHLHNPPENMKANVEFNVYNRSDDPQYEVWVKFFINDKNTVAETIGIDFPTIGKAEVEGKDVSEVAAGSHCLSGRDKSSLAAFMCVINVLNPRESFSIVMTLKTTRHSSPIDQLGTISTEVLKYSNFPGRRFSGQGKLQFGQEHTTPELFTPTTMIHYCAQKGHAVNPMINITCTLATQDRKTKPTNER